MQLTKREIIEGLKEVLKSVDDSKTSLIDAATEQTRLTDDLGLTSVGMLYAVISIEERFGIVFDDIGMDDFATVGDVARYVAEKL